MRKYLSNSFTSLFLILVSTLFGQNSENTRGVEIEMKSERIRLSYVDPSGYFSLGSFFRKLKGEAIAESLPDLKTRCSHLCNDKLLSYWL